MFALCHGLMVSPTLGPNFIRDFYFACYRTRTTALWVSRSSKSESACAFAAACKRMYVTACNGVCGLRRTYGTCTRVTLAPPPHVATPLARRQKVVQAKVVASSATGRRSEGPRKSPPPPPIAKYSLLGIQAHRRQTVGFPRPQRQAESPQK